MALHNPSEKMDKKMSPKAKRKKEWGATEKCQKVEEF